MDALRRCFYRTRTRVTNKKNFTFILYKRKMPPMKKSRKRRSRSTKRSLKRSNKRRSRSRSNSPTRGWRSMSPSRGLERRQSKSRCGSKCFLRPANEGFPICARGSCAISCQGLHSAKNRASQYHYADIIRKADRLLTKYKC
jgi:hypothetical protein